jgi:hypothetical protein
MNGDMGLPGAEPSLGQARDRVSGPAIGLIVVGGIGVLMALWGMVQSATGANQVPEEMFNDPNMAQYRSIIEGSQRFGIVGNVLVLLTSGLTIFGALKMKNLQSYGLAMAASIVAMIPCIGPCCCVGLPIGIWSIVTLSKPEIKAAFDNVSRGQTL